MSNELEVVEPRELSVTAQAEMSRAIQEVQAKLIMAKKFPRDMVRARARILEECKILSLAEQAAWKYPRSGEMLTGPSIRLAEVVARNYGNIDYGVRELERKRGSSVAQSYCWDLESNVTSDKIFEVPHMIEVGRKGNKSKKMLTDPRDIYELVANNGARRLRECILAITPRSIVDDALKACKATLANGGGEPIEKRLAAMVMAFKTLGVSPEMIEERVGHKIDLTTGEEIADLLSIYTAIREKQAKRGDFFNFPEDVVEESASAIADKIAGLSGEAQQPIKHVGQFDDE